MIKKYFNVYNYSSRKRLELKKKINLWFEINSIVFWNSTWNSRHLQNTSVKLLNLNFERIIDFVFVSSKTRKHIKIFTFLKKRIIGSGYPGPRWKSLIHEFAMLLEYTLILFLNLLQNRIIFAYSKYLDYIFFKQIKF